MTITTPTTTTNSSLPPSTSINSSSAQSSKSDDTTAHQSNEPSAYHSPTSIRLRKGTRFEDTYPISFSLRIEEDDSSRSSHLVRSQSPFKLQEYIAHLVRADPHAVDRIINLPNSLVPPELWIYEQLRRLALDLSHPLVSSLQAQCNRTSCPEMKAGEWLYLCAAHAATNQNECCAIDYIIHTLDGATALLNSARYFPTRSQIPPGSVKHFTSIARRLYRIMAHAWFHHRDLFDQCEMETSLYARFMALSEEFDLVAEDLLVIPRVLEEEGHHDRLTQEQLHQQHHQSKDNVDTRHHHHPSSLDEQQNFKLQELSSTTAPIVHHILCPIDDQVVLDSLIDKTDRKTFQFQQLSA